MVFLVSKVLWNLPRVIAYMIAIRFLPISGINIDFWRNCEKTKVAELWICNILCFVHFSVRSEKSIFLCENREKRIAIAPGRDTDLGVFRWQNGYKNWTKPPKDLGNGLKSPWGPKSKSQLAPGSFNHPSLWYQSSQRKIESKIVSRTWRKCLLS